jgi:hypothetical protein
MKNIFYIALGFIAAASVSCSPLGKARQAEQPSQVKQAVEGKNLRVEVSYASPAKMQPRTVSGGYDFALQNDSAFAHLPYFGEVYGGAAAYGDSEGGIKFREPVEDYRLSGNEKEGYEISFKVKSSRDGYQVFLSISTSGYATISITPTLSSHISYNGELVFKDSTGEKE